MHKSSMLRMKWFVENYVNDNERKKVLDVGAMDVNGSYKKLFEGMNIEYYGLDIEKGPNVDIVMDKPYEWRSVPDEEYDYIITGQAFEHMEYPWEAIKEMYKKLKKEGLMCIIAPNSIPEHKYPYDCYRYFSDGLVALAKWVGLKVLSVSVAGVPRVDCSPEWDHISNDVVLVAKKTDINSCDKSEYPDFLFERRFNPLIHLKNENKCLLEYCKLKNIKKHSQDYFEYNGIKKIMIQEENNLSLLIKEQILCGFVELLDKSEQSAIDNNTLIVLAEIDSQRNYINYYQKKYPASKIIYIDEFILILKYFELKTKYKKIYLYGAGKIGKEIISELDILNLNFDGVIVSNKSKEEKLGCYDIRVIDELEKSGEEVMIVSVGEQYKNEIIDTLNEHEFTEYIYYTDLFFWK